MHYLFVATFAAVFAQLTRVAVAAWLANPRCKSDADTFLRVFKGLSAFDAVTRLFEARHDKAELPPKDDA